MTVSGYKHQGPQCKYIRIFHILNMLSKGATIENMAREMGISERSVYRYMNTLRDAGFKIWRDYAGKHNLDTEIAPDFVHAFIRNLQPTTTI